MYVNCIHGGYLRDCFDVCDVFYGILVVLGKVSSHTPM